MANWIQSREAALITAAGAAGSLAASLLGADTVTEIVTIGTLVGSVAHLVDRVVQAFIKGLGSN